MNRLLFVPLIFLLVLTTHCDLNESPPLVTLNTTSHPEEGGIIESPSKDYERGAVIEISAEASDGWRFDHWEGDLNGDQNPVSVEMDQDKNVTAFFEPLDGGENAEDEKGKEHSGNPEGDDQENGEQEEDQGSGEEEDNQGRGEQEEDPGNEDPVDDQNGDQGDDQESGEQDDGHDNDQDREDQENVDDNQSPGEENPGGHLVIMPLGDSITNDGRSRIRLWHLMLDEGYTIDFVGDQRQETHIPDPHHEGVGGITIQGIQEKAESLMSRHNPEYINLMVGTNNIAWYLNEPYDKIAERWNDLVQTLLDHSDPEAWVIAATIPPVTPRESGHDSLEEIDRAVVTRQFNEELRQYIVERRKEGDRIVLADMEKVMTIEDHLFEDGVHLNAAGYELMGTVQFEVIMSILEDD